MKKGFTAIEVMIVIAMIAILAAIAVPGFLKARQAAQQNLLAEQAAANPVSSAGVQVLSFVITKDLATVKDEDIKRALSAKEVDPGSVISIASIEIDGVKKARIFYLKQ